MNDLPTTGRLLLLVPTTSYRIGDFLDAAERLGVDWPLVPTKGKCWKNFRKAAP